MAIARKNFLERLHAYRLATQVDIIVSRDPSDVKHNSRARLFRNGLAVVAYAIIEDFIKTRTAEVLERIGNGAAAFNDLPDGIKFAATSGVINALRFQEKFLERRSGDYYRFIQAHARAVASTSDAAYEISSISFGFDQSNIGASDIVTILTAFGVENPWNTLGSVATRARASVVDLKSVFENAAARRHKAAHQANADIETSDLISFGRDAVSLAIAFDLLLSHSLRKILDADKDHLTQKTKVAGRHIEIRFLEYDGSKWWRELINENSRAYKRDASFTNLKTACLTRARAQGQAVVLRDERGLPAAWFTPDID